MTILRHHLSRKPEPFDIQPRDQEPLPSMKPKGLWYEVDGDWRRWCADERYETGEHLMRLELSSENMLLIDNLDKLDEFHHTYAASETYPDPLGRGEMQFTIGIHWNQVAEHYDGIEIAPYQWSRRLELGFIWYYGWDCASGVIWRPRGARLTREENQ